MDYLIFSLKALNQLMYVNDWLLTYSYKDLCGSHSENNSDNTRPVS